jgi:ribosomal protein L22
MEAKAIAKHVRCGARKVRRYADLVRRQPLAKARGYLAVQASPAAKALSLCLESGSVAAARLARVGSLVHRFRGASHPHACRWPTRRPRRVDPARCADRFLGSEVRCRVAA